MRVTEIGSRPAPRSLRELISQAVLGRGPSIRVERREIPYWVERGWTVRNGIYRGNYQTPYAAFEGCIEASRSGRLTFFLFRPSAEIRSHSHWVCFQNRGDGWFRVHMARQPKDASSGIITIERLISEAYTS